MSRSAVGRWWAKPENRLLYGRVMYYVSMTLVFLTLLLFVLAVIGSVIRSSP